MVPDDLVERSGRRGDGIGQPRRECLMEPGSFRLGQCVVRGVTDEDVSELERSCGRPTALALQQLFPDEFPEPCIDELPADFRREGRNCRSLEDSSNDGAPLGDGSLRRRQPIDPGCKERLDRRRHREGRVPGFEDEPNHLLDEERVALGGLEDATTEGVGKGVPGSSNRVDQLFARLRVEAIERQSRGTRRVAPLRRRLGEFRPRRAHDEDRRTVGLERHVLEQLQHRKPRPVDVLDHEHEWPVRCQALEHAPSRPRDLVGRCGPLP